MKLYIKILTGIIIILSGNNHLFAFKDSSFVDYKSAKELTIAGQWKEAINNFQTLIDSNPESIYHDDALFWIGYCLEKMPGQEFDAFMAYGNLIETFPNSAWKDDALIHQIDLARSFWNNEKIEYKTFLEKQSQSNIENVRMKALLVIDEMKIQPGDTKESNPGTDDRSVNLEAVYSAKKTGVDREEMSKESDDFLFSPSERYQQYRKMLRDDNDWSKEELFEFGMWTILPDDQFSYYFALNGYDKNEWYRKFWVLKDPTPTTEENEALLEFERRVLHSKAYFGRLVDYKSFKYLRDQDLRDNWYHAPWDARGELYIKYGEPDYSSIAGFRQVEWTYNNLHVDFVINLHMTNIYGNAISPGPLSFYIYKYNLGQIDSEYIYNSDFQYSHTFNNKPIEDAEVNINGNTIEYSIPHVEIATDTFGSKEFIQTYVIYNDDMNVILGDDTRLKVKNGEKNIQKSIVLNLAPGEYMMALRMEDMNSDKLGIFKKRFIIRKTKDSIHPL